MLTLKKVSAGFGLCVLLLTTASVSAQQQTGATAKGRQQVDIFATAKPGQWADIKGPYQKDNSIMATKIKFVSGAISEGDCEISGKIISLDPEKREIKIARQLPIKCAADAEFKDKNGVAIAFTSLKVGMMVEAEGTYQKEGVFLAAEIEEDEIKEEEEADYLTVFGKIEKADASAKTIQIMGMTFVVTEQTKSKASIK